ncbi:MAG TPA: hypothetical protein VMS77_09345 [Conexivisphaerales archaeon]|nr:hypothetical protein [Conexivisphaerales archaeon]
MRTKRRAISRLIEAILAAIILASSLSISYFYLVPANPTVVRGSDDLAKMGYDLLSSMASTGGFDTAIVLPNGTVASGWESPVRAALGSLLPPGIIFNLTVYEAKNSTAGQNLVDLVPLNAANITNAQPANITVNGSVTTTGYVGSFLSAGQTAQVTFMYTTRSYYILVLVLQLARSTNKS